MSVLAGLVTSLSCN